MIPPQQQRFSISVEKKGPGLLAKATFPRRYGRYSEIKTAEYEFVFNLNGEIKFIRGTNVDWPHPAEQLKRTDGNDWVYYTVGDKSSDKGLISWTGEYYLPCLPYPGNAVWEVNYFSNPSVMNAFGAWSQLYGDLYMAAQGDRLHPKARDLVQRILAMDHRTLHQRAQELQEISGGRISVLPPDTRHVDYEIVPLMIADGCLYHCKFCCVKTENRFRVRKKDDIAEQIRRLKDFYGPNIGNYNSLFLGNHDGLASGEGAICPAASDAFDAFGFKGEGGNRPTLFLFGSVDALLRSPETLFEAIDDLPFYTYINIGFESPDSQTLAEIGKPINAEKVREAFEKMLRVNSDYPNIDITGNFLIGQGLSQGHYSSLEELLRDAPAPPRGKGAIYMSPLKDSPKKRELLPQFYEIKEQSRLPVYVYLIQRL